jgi:glycosyltransferase involved in cell wall biosynthesis
MNVAARITVREPRVTVVVPCYNGATTIGETLESLLAQTLKDWEAVIVNDASTDHSVAVVEKYAANDSRFRLLHHAENKGLAATRNTAIRHARAPLVNFLDADDWLAPEGLERLLSACEQRPESTGAYGGWTITYGKNMEFPVCPVSEEHLTFESLTLQNYVQVPSVMLRREALGTTGLFEERLRRCEDWDLWIRVYRCGFRLARTAANVGFYRSRPDSLSHQYVDQWSAACEVVSFAHEEDPRCRASPGYAQGLGEGHRAQALQTIGAYYLASAVVWNQTAAATEIADRMSVERMPWPSPRIFGICMGSVLATVPQGEDFVARNWSSLERGVRFLGNLARQREEPRSWHRDVLSIMVHVLPRHFERRRVLMSAIRAGVAHKPIRLWNLLRTCREVARDRERGNS